MKTLPKHRRSGCSHKLYHLSCDEFTALEHHYDGCCAICDREMGTELEIEHDHAIGARATRGLVCPSCNQYLKLAEAGVCQPSPSIVDYLAAPWFRLVGIDGRCPTTCRNREHARWLAAAREPSRLAVPVRLPNGGFSRRPAAEVNEMGWLVIRRS